MSDEEFITYINKFTLEESEAIKEIDTKACKKIITGGSILNGLALGLVPVFIFEHFTDDNSILVVAYIIGAIVGIPMTKKALEFFSTKITIEDNKSKREELLNLKKDLENLSESELSFLVNINKNKHIYKLHERISNISHLNELSSFMDTLEVTYKDDDEKLGYSKNITTNN